MPNDVVVVGRRVTTPGGDYTIQMSSGGADLQGSKLVYQQEMSPDSDEPPELQIGVLVQCSTPDGCQKAQRGAEQLVIAIFSMLLKLEAADPSISVTIAGRTITVGQLRDTIMATKYTVTDQNAFSNRGGGTADRATMTDTIFYGIIGEPSKMTAGGVIPGTGYQAYLNGLLGLVLHEALHMSEVGDTFYQRTAFIHDRDITVTGRIYEDGNTESQDYSLNNEALANYVAREIGSAVGINLQGFIPGFTPQNNRNPLTPEAIYEQHNGTPFTG